MSSRKYNENEPHQIEDNARRLNNPVFVQFVLVFHFGTRARTWLLSIYHSDPNAANGRCGCSSDRAIELPIFLLQQ